MPQIPKLIRLLEPDVRAELDRRLRERRESYAAVVDWLATRGCHTCILTVRKYAIRGRLRESRPHPFLRIDKTLSPEERTAYEAVLADPQTTAAVARDWLAARGYTFAADTVDTHRARFHETCDTVRETAKLATRITELARRHGDVTMSNGMLTRFEQVMLEQLVLTRQPGPIPARDLADMSKSIASAVVSREMFEAMRRDLEEAKRKALEGADAAAKEGATGREVVERVREILGMPPLPVADEEEGADTDAGIAGG